MTTRLIETPIKDLFIVEIDYFVDERGFFIESWHKKNFKEIGIDIDFVQDSHSRSGYKVLRGLHYQDMTAPMAKLVRCTIGKVFDVAVDIRVNSRTFGKWYGCELSAENKKQLFIPVGFAHGFQVTSDVAEVQYKQSGYYTPSAEGTIGYNDAKVAVEWPINDPILSPRDQNAMSFGDYLKNPAFK